MKGERGKARIEGEKTEKRREKGGWLSFFFCWFRSKKSARLPHFKFLSSVAASTLARVPHFYREMGGRGVARVIIVIATSFLSVASAHFFLTSRV